MCLAMSAMAIDGSGWGKSVVILSDRGTALPELVVDNCTGMLHDVP